MTDPGPHADTLSREAAQRRADRVAAFREELAQLEREGALLLSDDQREGLARHHEGLLERLARTFEVDRTERQRRLSAGMMVATLLGTVTLAAALYTFLYRFWGGMPVALQTGVVVAAPLLLVAAAELAARRERTLYVTLLLGLLAGTAFVAGTTVLASLLGVALPPEALLAWAAFAAFLAFSWELRLLLVGALLLALGYVGTLSGGSGHCLWDAFGHRPETFLPLGGLFFGLPFLEARRLPASFAPTLRSVGLLAVLTPVFVLGRAGHASLLSSSDPGAVEAAYQLLGFVLAALGAALGVRRSLPEVTALGGGAFVLFLYVKLFDWWWASLPRWAFFLLLGLVAVGVLLLLRRLRAASQRGAE
jgi:uncharacterized membrane protein